VSAMSAHRMVYFATLLALASMLVLSGCKSKTQQAGDQQANPPNAQTEQNPQQAANAPAPASSPNAGAATSSPSTAARAPQAPPQPVTIVLPEGASIRIRLDQDLGSKVSRAGDAFNASVADDVVVNGQVVIAKSARAEGSVIDAKSLGKIKGGATLSLRLERVDTRWGNYPVSTGTFTQAEKGKGKRTAEFAGGGGAFGAIVGGLAGGKKGALIGGLAGAGAGTAGSAMTGNKEIFLPAETLLTFRLEHAVQITKK
jgi:hypothetical protein